MDQPCQNSQLHKLWTVSDVVDDILRLIDRQSLARLARVSKVHWELAASFLWKEIDLPELLMLFPPIRPAVGNERCEHCRSKTHKRCVVYATSGRRTPGLHDPMDWNRLCAYAPFISSLFLSRRCLHASYILKHLDATTPPNYHMPALRAIRITVLERSSEVPAGVPRAFLAPTLQRITLDWVPADHGDTVMYLALADSIQSSVPNVSLLSLQSHPQWLDWLKDGPLADAQSHLINQYAHSLQMIDIQPRSMYHKVSPRIVEALADLPGLLVLSLCGLGLHPISIPPNSFTQLQRLISKGSPVALAAITESLPSHGVSSLQLDVEFIADIVTERENVPRLFTAAGQLLDLKHLRITVPWIRDWEDILPIIACRRLEILWVEVLEVAGPQLTVAQLQSIAEAAPLLTALGLVRGSTMYEYPRAHINGVITLPQLQCLGKSCPHLSMLCIAINADHDAEGDRIRFPIVSLKSAILLHSNLPDNRDREKAIFSCIKQLMPNLKEIAGFGSDRECTRYSVRLRSRQSPVHLLSWEWKTRVAGMEIPAYPVYAGGWM